MRGLQNKLVITLIFILSGWKSFSQDTLVSLSLKEAMDYAAANNNVIKNARLDVLIQEAKNAQVTASALPQVSGTGQFTDYIDPMKAFVPGDFIGQPGTFVPVQFSPIYSTSANINASQILFDGSVLVALQARKTVIELAEKAGKLTEIEIKYNVQKAYNSLVVAHKQFNILKSSLSYARQMAAELEIMRKEGFIEKIDVDRTNVQVNNLASDSIRTANLLLVSEKLMKYQMGMDINTPVVLTDTNLDNYLLEADALLDVETSYGQRVDYQLSLTQLKANEYNLKRYRLAGLPSLVANGSMGYNYGSDNFRDLFNRQYIWSSFVGLQLNVPIFKGFQRTNQIKEVKLDIEKSNNDIEYKKQTIDFETSSAKTSLQNYLLQFDNEKRNVDLAASVLDLARTKYKEGVGSNLEVSEAQTQFLQAQANYFTTMLNIINAEADLQKALGLIN